MELVCLKYDMEDTETGKYIASKILSVDGVKTRYFSRAVLLWSDINKRCGNSTSKNPRYTEVTNDFLDFQDFSEWANSEYGYKRQEDSGRMWAIDKDILLQDNKSYNPNLCMFVPTQVNGLFVSNVAKRGNLPIGVSMDRNSIKASCRDYIDGKSLNVHLGMFDNYHEAHKAWQKAKVQIIVKTANQYKEHKKLYYGLLERASQIESDILKNQETIWR